MDSMTICSIFRKLEDLKEYSKGKLTQCLADPTNELKLNQLKAAHKEWTEQFIRVQRTMADFIDSETDWMYTMSTDDIRSFSQLHRDSCKKDEKSFITESAFSVPDRPVPQNITNRVCETLKKIDTVYEYETVGQNIIKIVDDCYECELHLDRYSYYFTDAVDGGHRSVTYYLQSCYLLYEYEYEYEYENPERLYTDYCDFRHSVEASGWKQPAELNTSAKESPTELQYPKPAEQALTQVTDRVMVDVIKRIIDDAVANRNAVDEGDVNKSCITVGIVAGGVKLIYAFGIDGEMDTFWFNNCCCVKSIRIEGFTIWSDGKYNKEEVKKAIDFYKEGGERNVRERKKHR